MVRGVSLSNLVTFYGTNGAQPAASLVEGADGNFYGTTLNGGASGNGTIFVLSQSGVLSTLVSFDGMNGAQPEGPLMQGIDGNFYGTTVGGGASSNGTVFMVTPSGDLTNLVSFGGTNGSKPYGSLAQGSDGSFYGTTSEGGNNYGTLFQLTTNGVLTTLAYFDFTTGANPLGGVVFGVSNVLYGTTSSGGASGLGAIFMFDLGSSSGLGGRGGNNSGTNSFLTNLYSFSGSNDGIGPQAGLLFGADGNLYGTAAAGGTNGYGSVFRISTSGDFTNLAFFGSSNGATPSSPLFQTADGTLYGTTTGGGAHSRGTVFGVTTNGVLTSLFSFAGGNGGANPLYAGVVVGTNGNLYGTTSADGAGQDGTVYELSGIVPGIALETGDQTASVGSTVMFGVEVTGSLPLKFQWQFNSNNLADGSRISGAKTPILTIANVATNNAGSYRVIVSNGAGSVTNDPAILTVVDLLANRPKVAITHPRPNTNLSTNVLTIEGTASGAVGVAVAGVYYQINGGAWQLASSANGWSAWSVDNVVLEPGSYTVAAYAVNVVGTPSTTNYVSFGCELPNVQVKVLVEGSGTVSPNYNTNSLSPEGTFKVTARPDPGNLFVGWTNIVSGATTNTSLDATLTFQPQSNLVLEATFVTNNFPKVQGFYNGLFTNANQGEQAAESSGFVELTVNTEGKFSGDLQTGGSRYSLKGVFDPYGNTTATIKQRDGSLLAVEMQLDLSGSSDQIEGTVTNANEAWQAELTADRCVFDGKATNAPEAGQYTMVIPWDVTNPLPGGDGYATVRVNNSGSVQMSGSLADGTKISQGARLSKDGQWPLYVSLYGGQGMLAGWAVLSNAPAGAVSGAVNWLRPAIANALYYGGGLTNEVTLDGARYLPPRGGTNVLSVEAGTLALSGGNLAESITNSFTLGPDNKVTGLGTNKLTLTFTTSSGLFRGSVGVGASKPAAFTGVVLQDEDPQVGRGYFLGTNQSGQVLMQGGH